LSLCKPRRRVKERNFLHSVLTSALHTSGRSASRPRRFTPEQETVLQVAQEARWGLQQVGMFPKKTQSIASARLQQCQYKFRLPVCHRTAVHSVFFALTCKQKYLCYCRTCEITWKFQNAIAVGPTVPTVWVCAARVDWRSEGTRLHKRIIAFNATPNVTLEVATIIPYTVISYF
jgi:hypothetical protein